MGFEHLSKEERIKMAQKASRARWANIERKYKTRPRCKEFNCKNPSDPGRRGLCDNHYRILLKDKTVSRLRPYYGERKKEG